MSDYDVRRAEKVLMRHGVSFGDSRDATKRERWRLIALETSLELLRIQKQDSGFSIYNPDITDAVEHAWYLIQEIEKQAPPNYKEPEPAEEDE